MKRIISIYLILVIFSLSDLRGQDPNYSQFINVPVYFNPAYTGLYTGARIRFSFRDQWPTLPYDFKAYHFTADLGDRGLPGSGGLGLILNSDNEGIGFIKNLNLGLMFSVRVPFSGFMVGQLGIKASWLQKRVNWDDFIFSDRLSEKYGNIYETEFEHPARNTLNLPDFGVGGIIQFADGSGGMTGNVGVAVDHLFEPDQSFLQTAKAPLPRKWVAHADLIMAIGSSSGFKVMDEDALKISPGIIYQNQGRMNSIQAGLNLTKFGIYLGAWYKGAFGSYANSAMVFMGGYRYAFSDLMDLKFTYSYDMQMTGALQGTGGAHEVTVVLGFGNLSLFGGAGSGGRSFTRGRGGYDSRLECSEF